MRGKYFFRVKSKRILFAFEIRRNITVIQGDSATGKTTLLHMLYEYLRTGRESGYSVSTDANYFVIVNRAPLKMLPYSIGEIYDIVTRGKHADIQESYHELRQVYSNFPVKKNNKVDNIILEDSNAGYHFYLNSFINSNVVSANGNSNIVNKLKQIKNGDVFVVADGAAFGSMVEELLEYFNSNGGQRLSVWLPESFEYLILKSGLIKDNLIHEILERTYDFVDSRECESWEQFFAVLLKKLTKGTAYEYSKEKLNEIYLNENSREKILREFPDEIREEASCRKQWQSESRILDS